MISTEIKFFGHFTRHVKTATLYVTHYLTWHTQGHVDDYSHCEYGEGYLIFTRSTGALEVWRLAKDFHEEEVLLELYPDEDQLRASEEMAAYHHSETLRGHFRPWALIQPPMTSRSSRFVYPLLLAASQEQAFIWDVPTGRLVATIDNMQARVNGEVLGRVNYVELNEDYVVVCGSKQLRIFLNRPQGICVYSLTASSKFHTRSTLRLTEPGDEQHDVDLNLSPRAYSWHDNDLSAKAALGLTEHDLNTFLMIGIDDFMAGKWV